MATYSKLTDDEKAAIVQSQIRNLEYQMYTLEIQVMAENAKTNPSQEAIAFLENEIAEKERQIASFN